MCLRSVYEVFGRNKNTIVGYKVFRTVNGKIHGQYYKKSKNYKVGEWYRAYSPFKIDAFDYTPYTAGFHIFETLSAAQCWCGKDREIFKVVGRDVRAKGTQGAFSNLSTIVCRQMKILWPVD